MTYYIILLILVTHFIGDFVFQTDKMAQGKSKSLYWLITHVEVYGVILIVFSVLSLLVIPNGHIFTWAAINACLHFVVDYFTSKLNSKLWAEKKMHQFFVAVGFDQLIHFTCLILTYKFLCS